MTDVLERRARRKESMTPIKLRYILGAVSKVDAAINISSNELDFITPLDGQAVKY